jgi:hypothetical protein
MRLIPASKIINGKLEADFSSGYYARAISRKIKQSVKSIWRVAFNNPHTYQKCEQGEWTIYDPLLVEFETCICFAVDCGSLIKIIAFADTDSDFEVTVFEDINAEFAPNNIIDSVLRQKLAIHAKRFFTYRQNQKK